MKFYCETNYENMSRRAANIIAAQMIMKPECVLGLATGSTPIGTYDELVEKYERGAIDFSGVTTVNLDEYRGISGDNDQSYRYFMNHHLFNRVNVDKARTFVPDGMEEDSDKACADYDAIIENAGGIDLQLLGLGHNGHIGFNEPASVFAKGTNCVNLSERTIEANKRFFESEADVPRQAYTMGIQTIMRARKILVVVSGEDKAEIVAKAFAGDITPEVPASILQLHGDVTIVGDEAAMKLLYQKLNK